VRLIVFLAIRTTFNIEYGPLSLGNTEFSSSYRVLGIRYESSLERDTFFSTPLMSALAVVPHETIRRKVPSSFPPLFFSFRFPSLQRRCRYLFPGSLPMPHCGCFGPICAFSAPKAACCNVQNDAGKAVASYLPFRPLLVSFPPPPAHYLMTFFTSGLIDIL